MGAGLFLIVVVGVMVWAHMALERNVNRMAQQLQDQLHAAVQRIEELERQLSEGP